MRCNYLGCFCVHSVPFVPCSCSHASNSHNRGHGLTAHTGHTVTKSAWRRACCDALTPTPCRPYRYRHRFLQCMKQEHDLHVHVACVVRAAPGEWLFLPDESAYPMTTQSVAGPEYGTGSHHQERHPPNAARALAAIPMGVAGRSSWMASGSGHPQEQLSFRFELHGCARCRRDDQLRSRSCPGQLATSPRRALEEQ